MWSLACLALVVNLVSAQWMQSAGPRDDLFSATSKLENLVSYENQLVDFLDEYVRNAEARLNTIKEYVTTYRQVQSIDRSSKLVSNPIDAYLLVKRLTVDWDDVGGALCAESNHSRATVDFLSAFRERANFPLLDDLQGAAVALVRLQETYRLDVGQLATGRFRGTGAKPAVFRSIFGLSARDLLYLGKHALSLGMISTAVEWFQVALDQADRERTSTADRDEIEPFLQATLTIQEGKMQTLELGYDQQELNEAAQEARIAALSLPEAIHIQEPEFKVKLYEEQTDWEESQHYIRLCRGEELRTPAMDADLRCRFVTNNNHFLLLQPLKLEEKSLDPHIVIFHDLLTEKQMDKLIELGKPRLYRSLHKHESDKQKDVTSLKRVSKNAWLKENDDPVIATITARIELATGLHAKKQRSAEDYQVANYGIGGLYVTHNDFLLTSYNQPVPPSDWEKIVGDRIATLMVYLTDVEAGGATVFPRIGVTLWPERGSAAFWWNVYRRGFGDENTRHGACPVLHGSKWISNKWIRYNDQFLTAPCGLHENDTYSWP